MAATLLLDVGAWDLVLNAAGNVAVATEPYALAQDAASAIKTFQGEVFFNTTVGVPYQNILGKAAAISYLKQQLISAALTVPDVSSAQVFISSFQGRVITGQVQVVSSSTGQASSATFSTVSPQGTG